MGDEKERTAPPILTEKDNITEEVLTGYFSAKNITSSCELCGTNLWGLTSSINGSKPQIIANNEAAGLTSETYHLPVVMAVCNNCGNIRFFARFKIEEWMGDRAKIDEMSHLKPGGSNG